MEQWKEYRLEDFIHFNPTISLKKGTVARKIAMDNLIPHSRKIYSWSIEPYSGGAKFQNGDTIMARITPCLENGKHSYVSILDEGEIAYGSTEYIVMRGINGISNNLFIYYLSQYSKFKNAAVKSMVGSSGRQRAQVDVLKNLAFNLPGVTEQKRIADFLSSLDDKIELNRQINDNLEQQAQALFNHYFVENTELLGEYDEVSLLDIASYTNGLAMQKYRPSEDVTSYLPVMKIKELGQGFTDSNSDICTCNIPEIYIINSGDIIFSWSGTLMVKIWCGETAGLNQHLFKVYSESYEKWFYYFWTKYHLRKFINIAKDKAVTMGHIKREDLAKSKVILPNQATLQNLNKIFSPIMDSIINNEIESKQQVQLRDTLLPRLMSGELKINEINN